MTRRNGVCPTLAALWGSIRSLLVLGGLLGLLAGCASTGGGGGDGAPSDPPDLSKVQDAVPKAEPKSKYGNPPSYVVHGRRYYVMDSAKGYVERGIASWYGKKFHGRRTSSGEVYNMYAMTAAHPWSGRHRAASEATTSSGAAVPSGWR